MIKFADRSNLSIMENWDGERKLHYSKRSQFGKISKDHVLNQKI